MSAYVEHDEFVRTNFDLLMECLIMSVEVNSLPSQSIQSGAFVEFL